MLTLHALLPTNGDGLCNYCADPMRDNTLLMVVEKDQDLTAVERANAYKGRYFILAALSPLPARVRYASATFIRVVETRSKQGLSEIVLALSATNEGEHTADRVRELLRPFRFAPYHTARPWPCDRQRTRVRPRPTDPLLCAPNRNR